MLLIASDQSSPRDIVQFIGGGSAKEEGSTLEYGYRLVACSVRWRLVKVRFWPLDFAICITSAIGYPLGRPLGLKRRGGGWSGRRASYQAILVDV